MSYSIPTLYRHCLKNLFVFRKTDSVVADHFLNTLKNMKTNSFFKMQKEASAFLEAFTGLIAKANAGENKSCLKVVRIYCNASEFVDASLKLNTTFESKAFKGLNQDLQYNDLNPQDKLFVQKVIKKVCDRKKKLRYKNTAVFLASSNSETYQSHISIQSLSSSIVDHFKQEDNKLKQHFEQMILEEQDKIDKALEELYRKGIVVV